MNEAWQLESAVARNEADPETFWIPAEDTRRSLEPGAGAKLLFVLPGSGVERMWVVVSDVLGPGRYRGRLANRPAADG